jgi:hypothetical protein
MISRRLLPTFSFTAAALALLIAGCGGGSSAPIAATPHKGVLFAYVQCMRSHGVPNFPDPIPGQGIPKDQIIRLSGSPQFSVATNACQHVMPADGLGPQTTSQSPRTRLVAALAFSRCVRQRGFPNFPDPTAQGQLTPAMVTAAGIDLHQPGLLAAGLACAPLTHGLITRAAVQRAVNGG